jgi:hypothetical protein
MVLCIQNGIHCGYLYSLIEGSNVGVIVGAIVGVCVLLILVILAIIMFRR